jgi:thioredoxin-related protein
LITPSGQRTTAKDWYEALKLTYKPAIVFFDKAGHEIIRKDAYFKYSTSWISIMKGNKCPFCPTVVHEKLTKFLTDWIHLKTNICYWAL